MRLPAQNLLAWEICLTLLHLVVIGFTLLRLLHRWRTKRMWWDDYSAIIPLVVDVAYVILMWLKFRDGVFGLTRRKSEGFIYSAWFAASIYLTIIWGSRFSLSLSTARIFPQRHICRRFAFGLSFTVSLSYLASFLVSALMCEARDGLLYDLNFSCFRTRRVHLVCFLCAIVLDFTAEILMIVTPLVMLWKVKLPATERRLILALFASNLISLFSLTALVTMWFFAANHGPDPVIFVSMIGLLQAAIHLLICNLLVVTMLIYRILLRKKARDVQAPEPPPPPVTSDPPTSNNLAIQSDDHNDSNTDWKSSDHSLTTSIRLTTIYDTLSRISSTPPASAPSSRNPSSISPSYVTRELAITPSS